MEEQPSTTTTTSCSSSSAALLTTFSNLIQALDRGFDVTSDIRLLYCKGTPGSCLVQIDQNYTKDVFISELGISLPNVSVDIEYSRGKSYRESTPVSTFHEVKDFDFGIACTMVNATKGVFISCDIPMAQFIISMNAALPASQKFIIHVLDDIHLFVQPHASEMIRSAISEFRDQNSYEKPA